MTKNILLIVVSLLTITTGFTQIDLNNGLVAYFPLDGDAQDYSQTDIDGIISGASLVSGRNDVLNTAYNFNGSGNFINCFDDDRGITDKVSISVWIKKTELGTDPEHVINKLVEANGTVKRGFYIYIRPDGHPTLVGRHGLGGTSGLFRIDAMDHMVVDGNWHHLLGIINENEWDFYVDGIHAGSFTSNSASPSLVNAQILAIGKWAEAGDNFYDGVVDEVRLYNRVLNTDEINKLTDISFIDSSYLSISNVQLNMNIRLFPNPAVDKIELDFIQRIQAGTIKVLDYTGRIVFVKEINNQTESEIDISACNRGIYFVIVETNRNGYFIQKIVKE